MSNVQNRIAQLIATFQPARRSRRNLRSRREAGGSIESLECRNLLTTIVLQGPSQSTDATLTGIESDTANLGGLPTLDFFRDYQGNSRRAVVQFDLASVTSVGTATLGLYQTGWSGTGPLTADLFAVNNPWIEGTGTNPYGNGGGVSWKSTGTQDWTTPFGGNWNTTTDFGNGPNGRIATGVFSSSTVNSWINFNVTSAVAA